MKEIWKDIKGYEGMYQVSNLGQIKSLERKVKCGNGYSVVKEKILKQGENHKGYKSIRLQKNYIKKSFIIHRLVAIYFIPNPQNKPQVNHIDGNKKNNKISNLEWCTSSENIIHSYNTGLNKCKLQLDENKIIELYTKDNIGYVEIAKRIKVSPSTIKRALLRNNIIVRGNAESHIKFKLTKEELKKLLENKSQKEIAKMLKLNERTIYDYKKEFGL